MKTVRLGNKEIPAAALGTWSWGTGFNGGGSVFGNACQAEDLKPVFQKAMDSGLTLWDTAAAYGLGASEKILGSFLKENDNLSKAVISTKFTPVLFQRKVAVRHSLQSSLKRLGTKQADIYWIHNAKNVERWTTEAANLANEGLIGAVGVSNHSLADIQLAADILANKGLKLAAVQNHYSLLYRESEYTEILDWCHKNGVLFFSYMVLEQGALSGKYSVANPLPKKSYRGKTFSSERLAAIDPLIKTMRAVGEAYYSVGAAEIAIAWAMAKGTVPIIGVTKESHINSIVKAMDIQLTENEIEKIERSAKSTGVVVKAFWEQSAEKTFSI